MINRSRNSNQMTKTTTMMALLLVLVASSIQSTAAWSVGPFAMKVPFVKSRSAAASMQSTFEAAATAGASSPILSEQSRILMKVKNNAEAAAAAQARNLQQSRSAVPTTMTVDSASFILNDSFQSSTVDMLYQQSMQRAGLQ
mmetsp:Transcript_21779/g.62006  ORF Transcript_21779/g.62006 Transcript_21779/m.62006 type:complete len:142 (-) Transcript_21779:218-643(-)